MAIKLTSHDGNVSYGIKEYVVDTPEDISNVPPCAMGSMLFVISTAELYMMNGEGKWVKI